MDKEYYKKYEPIWGAWQIKELLGEGSFGKVYELERNDYGGTYKAALKAITIPQSQSEIDSAMANGMDDKSVTAYFRGLVDEIVNEFVLMSKLKGNSNVVSYEDHTVIEHTDGIGWDILIRMELLTPLNIFTKSTNFSRKDVIRLGIDMCTALELCQKYNIIHRDIKPENIFVSENGNFKLGDFGIARTIEKTTGGLSKKGTYNYMAPEVYRSESYGSGVDIYSLGLVLYRLLNENRLPFLPAYPVPIAFQDMEKALMQRISGAKISAPKNAEGRLAEIVLKACTYNQADRYSTPMQMRDDLNAILYNEDEAKIIYAEGDDIPLKSNEYITENRIASNVIQRETVSDLDNKTESIFGNATEDIADGTVSDFASVPKPESKSQINLIEPAVKQHCTPQPQQKMLKKKKGLWIAIGCVSALFIIGLIGGLLNSINQNEAQKPVANQNGSQSSSSTSSQWEGFVWVYQVDSEGHYVGGDQDTAGEKFTLPLGNNSGVINSVEIASESFPETMKLGQKKDFRIKIKTPNKPNSVTYITSKVKEDNTFENSWVGTYTDDDLKFIGGYVDAGVITEVSDTMFKVGDQFRVRIAVKFNNLTGEDGKEGICEEFYFDRYMEVVE